MNTRNKLDHIVLLRAVAIILVVFAHATRDMHFPNSHMHSPGFTPWWEVSIKSYIYSFHMPLFFWISGYVFYYSTIKKSNTKGVLIQVVGKFSRLIIPMWAISLIVLLPAIIFFGHINGSLSNQVKLFILGSDNDHLWFLKSLFFIFVLVIPMRRFLESNSKFLFILPLLWLGLDYWSLSHVSSAIKYFPFFMIGFYWCEYEYKLTKPNSIYFIFVAFAVHTMLFVLNRVDLINPIDRVLWYLTAIAGIYYVYSMMCIAVNKAKSSKLWNGVILVESSSYSIYLWHVPLLYFILFLFWKFDFNNSLARITVSFFVGLSGSICIHYLLTKTKKIAVLFGVSSKSKV